MGSMSGGGGSGNSQMISQGIASVGEAGNFLVSNYQNNKAANDLTQRQNQANALYTNLYGQTQQDYAPWIQGGQHAFDALLNQYGLGSKGAAGIGDYSAFENSPDYQFAVQQGQKNVDTGAANRGGLFSGQQLKATQQYGQGLATQNLNNYLNRLTDISGQGMQAQSALTNYRQGYGVQEGQGITNLGDIAAAERLGIAGINDRYNQRMQNIWGVGSGGGGGSGGGMSSAYRSGGSMDQFANSGSNFGSTGGSNFNMSPYSNGGSNWLNQGLSGYGGH